jgi:archaellum biogenesis ATPase FlaH
MFLIGLHDNKVIIYTLNAETLQYEPYLTFNSLADFTHYVEVYVKQAMNDIQMVVGNIKVFTEALSKFKTNPVMDYVNSLSGIDEVK